MSATTAQPAAAAPREPRGVRLPWLERRGRAGLVFFACAALFGWELFLPGRILLPIAIESVAPWRQVPASSVVPHSNPEMLDALILTLPGRAYNGAMLRQHHLPFWNPHVFGGYPHLALIQNNALYPLSAPLDVLSPWRGIGLSLLLHLAIAGGLMFAFLRRRGLDARAALIGGLAFELNGFFLVQLGAPSYVFSGTWLPLLLLGVDGLCRMQRLKRGLAIAIGTALSVLGGHPQITSLVLAAAGAYAVWRASRRLLAATLARFAVLALLGLGLAAFQVVPFLELMSVSARGEISGAALVHSILPAPALLQAILPDAFGHPAEGTYWFAALAHLLDGIPLQDRYWGFNYSADNLFTGWAPLVLTAVALWRPGRHRGDVGFFAVLALASLAIALGTPALAAAHLLLPGFRVSRPDRILYLYIASLAALSGYGLDAVLRRAGADEERASHRFAWAALGTAAAIVLWSLAPSLATAERRAALGEWVRRGFALWSAQGPRAAAQLAAAAATLAACAWLAQPAGARRSGRPLGVALWAVLVAAPLLWFGWKFNPVQQAPHFGTTAAEQRLVAERGAGRVARIAPSTTPLLPANAAQLVGLDDANGAGAAALGDYAGLIAAADPHAVQKSKYFRSLTGDGAPQRRLLDLLSVDLVLSDRELGPPLALLGADDGLRLYRNPSRLPRFFLVSRIEAYQTPERGRARLLAADFDPATTVLLAAPAPQLGAAASEDDAVAGSRAAGSVSLERFAETEIELRVRATRDAVLVTSEAFYPGWEAWLDDASVETRLVNLAFRGIVVPRGEHRVRMSYVPRTFFAGLVLSFASLVLVAWIAWLPAQPVAQGAPGAAAGRSPSFASEGPR